MQNSKLNIEEMQNEIIRLNKIITALMNRAERSATIQGSDYNLFQTTITLENKIQSRIEDLNASLLQNEKITRSLRESENHNRLLIENSPMGIYEVNKDSKILSINHSGLLLHGFKEEEKMIGTLYLDTVSKTDKERISKLLASSFLGVSSDFEYKYSHSKKIFKSCFVPIKKSDGVIEKVMGIMEDITERKKMEEDIRNLAFFDPLTGLANRRLLNERLAHTMLESKRNGCYGAVLFMDLDNFKPINDTHGHDAGDLLLIEVAKRLRNCVREIDTVARFGGDEFVIMFGKFTNNYEHSCKQVGVIAEKIRVKLAESFFLTYKNKEAKELTVEHHCTASIGVSMFFNHNVSSEEIFKQADIAMYKAKEVGRNRVVFFSDKNSNNNKKYNGKKDI
jgi:diguanylate cyclase (GGDEF)-like protein/PAS domain S-box-containing protein